MSAARVGDVFSGEIELKPSICAVFCEKFTNSTLSGVSYPDMHLRTEIC